MSDPAETSERQPYRAIKLEMPTAPPPEPVAPPEPRDDFAEAMGPVKISGRDRMAARQRKMDEPPKPPVLDEASRPGKPSIRDIDKMIADEMESALAEMEGGDPFTGVEFNTRRRPAPGTPQKSTKTGTVMSVRGNDIFIDLPGSRSQGVLSRSQFPEGVPAVGDTVEAMVDHFDPANGLLVLTRQGQAIEADWSTLETNQTVEARITGVATNSNKDKVGLTVEVSGIKGFMPISQIEMFRVEQLDPYLNTKMLVQVIELDRGDKRLIVSRRALLELERQQLAVKLWEELAEGQVHEGTVRLVKPFGAFVDIGGADGLLPTGEMSWTRINDPAQIVSAGQKVKVIVRRLDRDARKITLSLRDLLSSPWDTISLNHPERSIITGPVTRIMDFGAFVEIEPGVEGLVHISEISHERIRRVQDALKVGETVSAMVMKIEKEAKRVALSIKAAKMAEAKTAQPAAEAAVSEEPDVPKAPRVRAYELKGGTGGGGALFSMPKS